MNNSEETEVANIVHGRAKVSEVLLSDIRRKNQVTIYRTGGWRAIISHPSNDFLLFCIKEIGKGMQ